METGSPAGDIVTAFFNSNAGGSGVPGIDTLYDAGNVDPMNTIIGPISYALSDFEKLFGSDTSKIYEQKVSLAFDLIALLFEEVS